MSWSAAERQVARALLHAILPGGRVLPAPDDAVLARAEAFVCGLAPAAAQAWRAALWALELKTLPRYGGRFSALPCGRQLQALEGWRSAEATRVPLRGLLAPLKLAYFEARGTYQALGCRHALAPPAPSAAPRWRAQVLDAGAQGGPVELECDVVVVGTGAGGAPVAAALAARGFAVAILEEGALHERDVFTGRPAEMMRRLYRNGGVTLAFGNTVIPVPVGMGVGGTTLVNSGTCFRVPDSTLREWRGAGLTDFTPAALDPYFAQVEEALEVAPSSRAALGKTAELIARGCDALGWSHHALARNAPGCDGQGLCCFGCPTDAKRSTQLSYIPRALGDGAQLFTGVKVERVRVEGETAVGVEGVARDAGGGRVPVRVRAGAVVLACGTLHTPALLQRNRLCDGSGELGRNLSLHPASAAWGVFDEEVNAWRSVPQGYAVDEFKDEGLYFEGATTPLELHAASHAGFGPAYVALMEAFNRTVSFGFMVKDTSRGRVRAGADGAPVISYWLNRADLGRMQRGFSLLAKLYFAAGAREVHLPIAGLERLADPGELEVLERAQLEARRVDISAYHPLGTCRLGVDPLSSVVGPTNETHDVHNLFVCDGSALPGSLGVNPQVTIMALSLRAAEHVARRLERRYAVSAA